MVGLQVFGLDVLVGHAVGAQDQAHVNQRARARFVHGHALALQVGHALDARALARHQVDALRVQGCDQAQVLRLGLAFEGAGAAVGPVGHVRLREAGFERAAQDAVDVGHRTVRGHGRGDELARLRHGVGDDAADGVVRAGRAARADAEELLGLCGTHGADRGDRDGQGGDPVFEFHASFSGCCWVGFV
ncbi:hypothetical protein D3C85_1109680 [compost metagenome]